MVFISCLPLDLKAEVLTTLFEVSEGGLETGAGPVLGVRYDEGLGLELQAAVLASKWLEFVVSESRLHIDRIFGWTDSLTTWYWVNSPSYRWKTYVANRVTAVQETTQKLKVTWKHCPGVDNPADQVSCGLS